MEFYEKVRKCEKMVGYHVHFSDAAVSEIVSYIGFDYIWLDMEHTYLSCEEVYHHLLAAKSGNTPVLVRVPVSDLTYTKRVCEMGPAVIVFPMVKNAEHAIQLLDWTLYPPVGKRGCGPKSAVKWGIDDEIDYYSKGSFNMCRFIQIEQKSAIDNIEEIAKIPYLDGCIFGLFDLSGSIGKPGDVWGEENIKLVKHAISVLKKHNKCIGISFGPHDVNSLKELDELGFNMITTGFDYISIIDGARESLINCKTVQKLQAK